MYGSTSTLTASCTVWMGRSRHIQTVSRVQGICPKDGAMDQWRAQPRVLLYPLRLAPDKLLAYSHHSAATDTSGAADLVIDARRGRLLKALNKLLMGPVLMAPMERLRLHSYALLGIMLVLHIACYVAVTM